MTRIAGKQSDSAREQMQPLFDAEADRSGLRDTIKRFKHVFADYQVLQLVESYLDGFDKSSPNG